MSFHGYEKTDILRNYDVFPKVFVKGKESEINIRSLGARPAFEPGKEYDVVICALEGGTPWDYPATGDFRELKLTCSDDLSFKFRYTFDKEMMYFIRFLNDEGRKIIQFPVYCVEKDLAGRWPLTGDLHMHTTESDGSQCPEVVCANYRNHGYDFMVVSDHGRYYPSLNAIKAFKGVKTGLTIVPGEEVHMPRVHDQRCDFHIVNFGGEYSINFLTETGAAIEKGHAKKIRSLNGKCPEFMPLPEWEDKMEKLAKKIKAPKDVDALQAAVAKWIFDEIRKANGLGIFAHPTWISNVYHVPEAFNRFITENKYFDAFEVLGGENYFEHNGFQTVKYYEDKAKGIRYPIVGSTDSHSSNPSNRNAYICSTMVFSPKNERTALISSIKDFYSVAIDTISTEFRVVGDNRLVRYATFLLKEYFPLHDELCFEEGRLMKQYVTGTEEERAEAKAVLNVIGDRVQKHREKYFDF